jgi:hypothetical protein
MSVSVILCSFVAPLSYHISNMLKMDLSGAGSKLIDLTPADLDAFVQVAQKSEVTDISDYYMVDPDSIGPKDLSFFF